VSWLNNINRIKRQSHQLVTFSTVLFGRFDHHTISGNILYDLTDHLPNFLIITKLNLLPKNITITRRIYNNYNESNLLQGLESIDWAKELGNSDDVSQKFGNFYSKLSNIIDKHVPTKTLSQKEIKSCCPLPWRISSQFKKNANLFYLTKRFDLMFFLWKKIEKLARIGFSCVFGKFMF